MNKQPDANRTGPYYAVANIATAVVIYSGKSFTAMAVRLAPGTCWGRGWSSVAAVEQCNEWREWFAARNEGKTDG